MIRKQIYIRPDQEEALKQKAREARVSEAELIREYIELGMQQPSETERKRAVQALVDAMEERAKIDAPQTGRQWTREELYEERFERYSR